MAKKKKENEPKIKHESETARVMTYLKTYWEFKKNEVLGIVEQKKKNDTTFEEYDPDTVYMELKLNNLKFSLSDLQSLLRSKFVKKYNPFREYFESLPPWDGQTDHIGNLSSHIVTENPQFFYTMFKKALVRCIACSVDGIVNRIVFLLVSRKQNIGKSTFIRWLNPWGMERYYTEAPLSKTKDTEFRFSENFIYNLEELDRLGDMEIDHLKAIVSKASVKERKPYAVNEKQYLRRCNFWGSTNRDEFLTDTSNTRWLAFWVAGISYDYKRNIKIGDVWAQAWSLYQAGFDYNLTPIEMGISEDGNKCFEYSSTERETVATFFVPARKHGGLFMTASQIIEYINSKTQVRKLNIHRLGKALESAGYIKGTKRVNDIPVKGWWLLPVDGPVSFETYSDYLPGTKPNIDDTPKEVII